MPMTNSGVAFLAQACINEPGLTYFDNTHAYLGVGDGVLAFQIDQTDLQGAHKARQFMQPFYPTRTAGDITFQALFAAGVANFDWNEWGVFNALTSGIMLNRKVETLGTKTSSQSWQLTVDLVLVPA